MNYLLYKNNLLLKLYKLPQSKFSQKDKHDRYLLHKIASHADEISIKYCIDKYPEALEKYDKTGMLPIHIALTARPPNDDAARIMIYVNPRVGVACDGKGRSISDLRGKHSDSLWIYNETSCCFPWLT